MSTLEPPAPTLSEAARARAGERQWVRDLEGSLADVIVGQRRLVRTLLVGLLTGGHVLLEGVPGLAKSLAVSSLAQAVEGSFARVQFTPDLLPSDLVGTEIYDGRTGAFTPRKGPIFANFVLADEVNRAPAKVQSALLEAMAERQVSIGGQTFPLPAPFLVLATQNPIDQEGTYQLPEAQLDRFAFKEILGYPDPAEELEILNRMARTKGPPRIRKAVDLETLLAAREEVDQVRMDPRLAEYIVRLVHTTRAPKQVGLAELDGQIRVGASPRASIYLALAARAEAYLEGRSFTTPSDVKRSALQVLRHRVLPTYEAEAAGRTGEDLVRRVLEAVPVP